MLPWWLILIIVISSIFGFYVISRLFLVPLLSKKPKNIGVNNGSLARCPNTPNCVSTQAKKEDKIHFIEPFLLEWSVDDARSKLLEAIASIWGKTKIIIAEGNYIHAENRSPLWGFVDDIEIIIDEQNKIIDFRSASRLGYSDNGVNRKRMEIIRKFIS